MQVNLSKSFTFEAAHWLPTFPEGHKCRRMHGHSFKVDVIVRGEVPESQGFLIDYGDIKRAIGPIEKQLDHYVLNDIEGLDNPTAEQLSRWIFERLRPQLKTLHCVRVHETCTSTCEYFGD
ncbi:MAG: 6-carboxytetrahydropterin synthase QueD [Planctomycetota bacterium]|jgi:6-pyruvoyltetrahydropterin/6-carboxytetrahydropterin synthase